MRSSIFFSAVLFLLPVLISGHPMMSRRDNSSSNSTVSTDPSNGNSTSTSIPTDSGSGNSTTSVPPTDGSNSTTSDPSDGSSNSTSSDPGGSTNSNAITDPIALELMSLVFQLNQKFYDAAINVSNGLDNPSGDALLGIAKFINGRDMGLFNLTDTPANCTFELSQLVDHTLFDLVASAAHLEGIALMAAQAILQNASISVSDADQDGLVTTITDASTLLRELGNVTATGAPLSAVPQATLADVGNLIRKYKPTCDSPTLLLDSLPATSASGFGTPYILPFGEALLIGDTGCANPNATAFCQVISDDPTANTTVTPVSDCVVGTKAGTVLVYITDSDTPLPSDPQERVGLQSEMCTGPDFFIVLNDVN